MLQLTNQAGLHPQKMHSRHLIFHPTCGWMLRMLPPLPVVQVLFPNGEIRVETTDTLTKQMQVIDQPTNGMHKMDYLWLVLMEATTTWMVLDLKIPGSTFAFAVINRHSAVANGVLLAPDGAWSGTKLHLATDSNGLNSKMALNGGGSVDGSNTKLLMPGPFNTFHRGDVTNWGSTGTIFHNGSTDATASLGANTLLSLSAFNIGNWHDGSTRQRHLDGDLAELIIYTANLSTMTVSRVEVYLVKKMGIALHST